MTGEGGVRSGSVNSWHVRQSQRGQSRVMSKGKCFYHHDVCVSDNYAVLTSLGGCVSLWGGVCVCVCVYVCVSPLVVRFFSFYNFSF